MIVSKLEIKKRIKLFKKWIYFYQKKYNLCCFEITITEQIKDNARASCYWNLSGYIATISYSLDWINNPILTSEEIKKVAKHECIELLMSDITTHLNDFYSEQYVSRLTHRFIRVLENII